MRLGILISGGGSNMAALLTDMAGDHPGEPALVLSNTADAGGLARAAAAGVATAVVDHRPHGEDRAAFEAGITAALTAHGVEMICLAGFMRILTPGFMDAWRGRILNIHPSLLPAFRGLNTHQRALDAGVAVHGCTVHHATAELDAGPIIGQAVTQVRPGEDAATLAARVLTLEHQLYPRALRAVLTGAPTPFALM